MRAADNLALMAHQGHDFESGFRLARERKMSERKILQFCKDMTDIQRGRLHPAVYLHKMQETQGTADFPLLMADSLDRALLGGYQESPPTYTQYMRRKVNRDFRTAKLFAIDGGEGLNERVPEHGNYPQKQLSETKYEVSVEKFGDTFGFSFEMMINDDLGAFMDIPVRMGRKVRRTEEHEATRLFATDAAKTALFTVGNGNIITGNPDLDFDALDILIKVASLQRDADGQPIETEAMTIVFPETYRAKVLQMVNATEVRVGDDTALVTVLPNYYGRMFTFVENKRLRLMGGTNMDTGWFAFANPNVGRPGLVYAMLAGHETPDLLMKAPDSIRVGGGSVGVMEGSFSNDAIQYKVRNFFGGTTVDVKAMYYSNGTNT